MILQSTFSSKDDNILSTSFFFHQSNPQIRHLLGPNCVVWAIKQENRLSRSTCEVWTWEHKNQQKVAKAFIYYMRSATLSGRTITAWHWQTPQLHKNGTVLQEHGSFWCSIKYLFVRKSITGDSTESKLMLTLWNITSPITRSPITSPLAAIYKRCIRQISFNFHHTDLLCRQSGKVDLLLNISRYCTVKQLVDLLSIWSAMQKSS